MCGRALEVRAIAVATGRHEPAALREAGADTVFIDFAETAAVMDAILA